MKIAQQVPVYLLAIVFLVFGLNFFFQFLPMPPMTGDAGTFVGLLYTTKYLTLVKTLEVILSIMLFLKSTRSLALILISPIIVNIFLFEILIAQKPGIGVVLLILAAIAIYLNRQKYMSIVQA